MKALISIQVAFVILLLMFSCSRKTSPSATTPPPSANSEKNETEKAAEEMDEGIAKADISEEGSIPLRNTRTSNPDTVVMIQTTACYGQCPVYKATILSNGNMFYLGKRHVDNVGYYKASISPAEIRKIDRKISAIGLMDMAERYPESGKDILDLSNTILISELKGERKKIYINHNAPVKLNEFITFIENIIKDTDWQPAKPVD